MCGSGDRKWWTNNGVFIAGWLAGWLVDLFLSYYIFWVYIQDLQLQYYYNLPICK